MKNQIYKEHEAKNQAINTLRLNEVMASQKAVLLACPQNSGNYFSVWTRDLVVSTCGIVQTDDADLLQTALNSWNLIGHHQTQRGRIPAYVSLSNPQRPIPEFGGWGRIETLDSQMWYVLGARELFKKTQDKELISQENLERYQRALEVLDCRETVPSGLITWPVSSGWDDQMQRRHHVLSLESLRILSYVALGELLQKAGQSERSEEFLNKAEKLRKNVRDTFWIDQEKASWIFAHASDFGPGYFSSFAPQLITLLQENPTQFFTSYLAPYEISPQHMRFDAYANILAILAGVASKEQSELIFNYIQNSNINKPWPIRVLDPVIQPGDSDHHAFYELGRNKPYHYQNGAIWPHITGLYILAAKKLGKDSVALEALNKMILMVEQPGNNKKAWGFNEYYHGESGIPTEDAHDDQAWSAGGLLYALAAVSEGKLVLPLDS